MERVIGSAPVSLYLPKCLYYIIFNFHCYALSSFPVFCESDAAGLSAYLTGVFTVVFGVLLVLNSLGCFFGLRWKKRQRQTGDHNGIVIKGGESVSCIIFCHDNVLIPQQNSKEITLKHDAIVCSASHSFLISPCPSFSLSILSPLLLLILLASTSCHIHPSKLSLLRFVHIFYLIC